MITHPFKKWKNITENPCVVIRRDILSFKEHFMFLKKDSTVLIKENKNLEHNLKQIHDLDVAIHKDKRRLKKEKVLKHIAGIKKTLERNEQHKKDFEIKQKIWEKKYVKHSASSFLKFETAIIQLYDLNLQVLTLANRVRNDIDALIKKVKAIHHVDIERIELVKYNAIKLLNQSKEKLKHLSDELYRTSEWHDRSGFNPTEVVKEFDLQNTKVKIRRIRQLTIEIDHVEHAVKTLRKSMEIGQIPFFVEHNINVQITDLAKIAHHTKIITHRFRRLIYHYPHNTVLKRLFKRKMRNLVKQTRYLWNSLKIKEYKLKRKIKQAA